MRILYLCKRQYMGHDVIADRYARLYEQPFQLACLGHDVTGLTLSYRDCTEIDVYPPIPSPGKLRWLGLSPKKTKLGILGYPNRALTIIKEFNPDILISASDCLHIILGQWLAKKNNSIFCVDLYDNFESFGLARIPGVKYFYRKSLTSAKVVSCVSEPLTEKVRGEYRNPHNVFTLHSTIDKNIFFPRDKNAMRSKFKLPIEAKIIGTGGGLSAAKGIIPLYQAFIKLVVDDPNLHLALAGTIDPNTPPPTHPRLHYLGKLTHQQTAEFFSALDVGVVYIKDTPYGRYSFPQKAYEMAACKIPMAVADVGAMSALFKDSNNTLYSAADSHALAQCLRHQLSQPSVPSLKFMDWAEQATLLEAAYKQCIQ